MALATYTDLLGAVASWVHRNDLTAQIPDFVTLAEGRIARDLRLRKQVVNALLSTVASTQTVALPSDFLEIENITLSSSNPPRQIHVVTPEVMDEKYPFNWYPGQPVVYCLIGDNIVLGPTPDAVYTISLDYYQRFPALSSSVNWLFTNYPSIYLYATLVELSAYTMNAEAEQKWNARYLAEVETLQSADDTALRSGTAMRVRAL